VLFCHDRGLHQQQVGSRRLRQRGQAHHGRGSHRHRADRAGSLDRPYARAYKIILYGGTVETLQRRDHLVRRGGRNSGERFVGIGVPCAQALEVEYGEAAQTRDRRRGSDIYHAVHGRGYEGQPERERPHRP
jgi:hypothetical protein